MTDFKTKGTIFDVKRFAIHDGKGIRTTLFIKGCPLRCPWCHNPEGRAKNIELMWFSSICVHCAECVRACSRQALKLNDNKIHINRERCTLNADCVSACPNNALKFSGRVVTAQQAYEQLALDKVFYMTNGGVTLSGGDPLAQVDFSIAVLKLCKKDGLNTAIETCLYAAEKDVMRFVPLVDQFFVDIKILDEEKHKKVIGKGNSLILSNFKALCKAGAQICVRIPLIPGFTDDDENIREIAGFVVANCKKAQIELLNYNPLAKNKFDTINETYLVGKDAVPLTEQEMGRKRKIVSDITEE